VLHETLRRDRMRTCSGERIILKATRGEAKKLQLRRVALINRLTL
jgi:hypothetical protein